MRSSKRQPPEKDDRLGNYLWELEHRPQSEIMPSDIVKFSDPLRAVFNQATRTGQITFTAICEKLDLPSEQAQKVIDSIIRTGFLRAPSPLDDEPVYKTRLAVHTRLHENGLLNDLLKKLDGF